MKRACHLNASPCRDVEMAGDADGVDATSPKSHGASELCPRSLTLCDACPSTFSGKRRFEYCSKVRKECKSRENGKWDGKCSKDELESITFRTGMDPLDHYRLQCLISHILELSR